MALPNSQLLRLSCAKEESNNSEKYTNEKNVAISSSLAMLFYTCTTYTNDHSSHTQYFLVSIPENRHPIF